MSEEDKNIAEITEDQLNQEDKALYLRGMSAVQVNNNEYAIKIFQTVLERVPGFLKARKILRKCEEIHADSGKSKGGSFFGVKTSGLSALKLAGSVKKDPLSALPQIEKELAKHPQDPALNDQLFEASKALGMIETAIFALETVRRHNPAETKYLHKLAEYYTEQSRGLDAAAVYRDILAHDPTDSAAIKGEKDATARASMQKANWREDAEAGSMRKDVEEAEELERQSRTGLTREQLEERRDNLIAKYSEDQNDLGVVKDLASTYERLEDWANAKTFYEWAFSLSKGDPALQTKADSMMDRMKEAELSELERRAKENPEDSALQEELKARRQERTQEVVREAKERVDHNPTDPLLRYELGKAYFNAGEFNMAIPQLQQARRNPHIQSKVLLLLGQTFKNMGMLDMGINQLETALENLVVMDNVKKEVLYEKGLMHEDMNDQEAAIACFKEIYEDDYGYRDVAQKVESSYAK